MTEIEHDVEAGYQDGKAGRAADPGIRDMGAYRGGWLIGRREWRDRADLLPLAAFDSNGRALPPPTFYVVVLETGEGRQPADPLFRTRDQADAFARCFAGARVWPVRLER